MDGFRRFGAMHLARRCSAATSDPFPASYSDKVRQIGVVNDKNRRLTNFVAKLLDGPDWLRALADRPLHRRGLPLRPADDRRRGARGVHPQGGDRGVARLLHLPHGRRRRPDGGDRQPGRGCAASHGLRVVDASLFPACPAPTPTFPTLMTARRSATRCCAALLRRSESRSISGQLFDRISDDSGQDDSMRCGISNRQRLPLRGISRTAGYRGL